MKHVCQDRPAHCGLQCGGGLGKESSGVAVRGRGGARGREQEVLRKRIAVVRPGRAVVVCNRVCRVPCGLMCLSSGRR